MEKNLKYPREFFDKLAHLMYAVAVADGKIVLREKITIKKIVEEHQFLPTIDTEDREIIYAVLRKLIKEQTSSEEAFTTFKDFYSKNPESFPVELRKNIMEIANKIAASYAGRNKSESVIISKLYFLLEK